METDRLRQFVVVARIGSLRAAADILHISPGGLSKSLDVLENELGLGPLFRRDGRNIALTDIGRAVEARSNEFLRSLEDFLSPSSSKQDAKLKISTFEVFSTYFLSHFLASAPSLGVICRERIPGQIELDVQSATSDIGLTYEPIPVPGVQFLKVCRMRMGVFGRKSLIEGMNHSQWPFAAPMFSIDNTPTGVKGLDGWPDDKVSRNVRFEVDMMETAMGLARKGIAVVHLPEFVAKLHNDVVRKDHVLESLKVSTPAVYRWVYLVQRSGESESKVTKRLTQEIRRQCAL